MIVDVDVNNPHTRDMGVQISRRRIAKNENENPQRSRYRIIAGLLATLFLCYMQQSMWPGNIENKICQNDRVIYSDLFTKYHTWVQENWNVRTVQVTFNTIWINLAGYVVIWTMFILYGKMQEALWTYLAFTYARDLCIRLFVLQHPIGNQEPGSAYQPGTRPYDLKSNDYYFSGHTASATVMLCMYIHGGYKKMAILSGLMVIYTGLDMTLHRGHFIHDVYIGFMITILIFQIFVKILPPIKYFTMRAYMALLFSLLCLDYPEGIVGNQQRNRRRNMFWLAIVFFGLPITLYVLYSK